MVTTLQMFQAEERENSSIPQLIPDFYIKNFP
jgi:hypothetical protein